MTLIAILLLIALIIFFIKWLKLKRFTRQLKPYYELLYNYDNTHKLTFAVVSPVMAVRPRSEYSGFTCRVYFDNYENAEAERQIIIEQNKNMKGKNLL